jgi:hypothetical protein
METANEADFRDTWVGFAMVLVVLFIPYHITTSMRATTLEAIVWRLGLTTNQQIEVVLLGPDLWFHPIVWLNYVFVIWMIRLYQKKTTKKRVIVTGLLPAMPLFILQIIFLIPNLWDPTWFFHEFFDFPFPLPLLVALSIIYIYPPPEGPTSWIERKE